MAAALEDTLYLDVPAGRVVIEMRPDLAPGHCAHIKALVQRGFYDGIVFHRVIAGFMAQTTINRHDFGVSWNGALDRGGVVVGNEVEITIDAEAILERP